VADAPPAGPGWTHEIKHDGFRIMAHRRGRSVGLLTRNGNDFADRFPLIAEAFEALPVKSCVVDGEAIPAMATAWRCSTSFARTEAMRSRCYAPST
jgi:ATP-dependent DNA ligase